MREVGTFRTTVMIENAERRGERRAVEDALVDTGSELTWVSRSVLESLGIRAEGVQRFVVADGREIDRELGIGIVHVAGRYAPDYLVFAEPGDMIILGSRSLEGLNLRVDAQRKMLVPAGPILAVVAASPQRSLRLRDASSNSMMLYRSRSGTSHHLSAFACTRR